MNLQLLLPIISRVVGRDLTIEAALFFRARSAVGSALSPEGQQFFIKNWPTFVDYMETQEGKDAISLLMDSWMASTVKEPQSEVA